MNSLASRFTDALEPIGVVVGLFLVLVGLATIAGMPWEVKATAAAAVQIVGALGTAAIGVGLLALSWRGRE